MSNAYLNPAGNLGRLSFNGANQSISTYPFPPNPSNLPFMTAQPMSLTTPSSQMFRSSSTYASPNELFSTEPPPYSQIFQEPSITSINFDMPDGEILRAMILTSQLMSIPNTRLPYREPLTRTRTKKDKKNYFESQY
jgi:hypothetical protein